jgi:hypothetical protein
MKYKISVRTIQGKILTFSTDDYKIEEGFVKWTDSITKTIKRFPVANCEINEDLHDVR